MPSVKRLRLMLFVSFSMSPELFVSFTRSLPVTAAALESLHHIDRCNERRLAHVQRADYTALVQSSYELHRYRTL